MTSLGYRSPGRLETSGPALRFARIGGRPVELRRVFSDQLCERDGSNEIEMGGVRRDARCGQTAQNWITPSKQVRDRDPGGDA